MESGLHGLPAEILGEVFAQALEIDVTHPCFETMKQLNHICLVCKEWRHVAVITHKLWRTFKISETLTPRVFQKAEQWLARAKTLPVGIAVSARTGHKNHCYQRSNCSLASPEFASILIESTMTIHHLSITCPSSVCFYQLLTRCEELRRQKTVEDPKPAWDCIQSLKLNIFDDWNQWQSTQEPNQDILTSLTYPIFYTLPPITSLTLHLPSLANEIEQAVPGLALNIPPERLSHLTELTLTSDWYAEMVLKALESCHRVERLTLDFINANFLRDPSHGLSIGVDSNATLLPSVRKLRILRLNPQALEYIRYFRSPLLEELDLEFTSTGLHRRLHQPPFSMEVVVDFLQRSQCTATLSRASLCHAPFRDVQHLQNRLPFMKEPRFFAERQGDRDTWAILRAT